MQTIYEYQSARRFVLDAVAEKRKSGEPFSIRRWAKEMGLNSHAHLVMLLSGKRNLTLKHVPALAQGLRLSTPERLYFQAMIQFENAKAPEEKSLFELWLSDLRPRGSLKIREVEEYRLIADWIHMAILAMSGLKNAPLTLAKIHSKLGHRFSRHEILSAIERLLDLGILEEKDGAYTTHFDRVTTRDDISNRGAREYHKQVARLAIEAVDAQDPLEREFQSLALSVPKGKIPLAKEMIRKFRTQFSQAMAQEKGDEVYQMNLQFFRLTESPSEMVPKEDESAGAEWGRKPMKTKDC